MYKTLLVLLVACTVFGQSFIPHQVTGGADFVHVTDMDGDGDVDILAADGPSDQVFWLENNGDSIFITHQIESTADWPRSLISTDWDGDGDLDVLSLAVRDNQINWYENDGNQSFSQHTIIAGIAAHDIAVTDIDSDGDMDIVSSSQNWGEGIEWFENSSDGSFVEHSVTAPGYNSIFVSDINDDGNNDIIGVGMGGVILFRNAGNGTFTIVSVFGTALGQGLDSYAIDMDGDDDVDIIASCDNGVAWFENNGSESFITHILDTDVGSLYSLHISDLNGDSKLDIITVDYGNNSVNWYESSGGSSPTFIKESLNSDEVSNPSSIVTVDIDGDWDIDVITACYNGLAIHENDGAVDAPTFTTDFIRSNSGQSINHAVDVDGDGDMDMLTANVATNKIAWLENNGNELFTSHTITTNALFPRDLYSVDMDMDGDIDILSASADDNKIAWYENDGTETFTTHVITLGADRAALVYAIDLDGDGDMDVLSASQGDNRIAWYENDGNQTFTEHEISLSADNVRSIHTADFDGDGDMDVLSASYFDDKIAWYENIDGAFGQHIITQNADGAESAFAADLDADGDMDVLSASSLDNRIAWYENDGNANFTAHNISTDILGAQSVFAADVDGDGTGYMIVFSAGTDAITWYEYLGNGDFSAHTIALGTIYGRELNAVDVDGDGTVDVVVSRNEGLTWYENTIDVLIENLDISGIEEPQHIVSHTPTISWSYSDNMTGIQSYYRIQVSSTSDFSILDMWSTGIIYSTSSTITYSGEGLVDGENYYLRVRAGSGAFWSEWQSMAFRMNTAPTAPQAISPINDEIVIEPTYLQVINSVDSEDDLLTYSYWVYSDNILTNLVDSAANQLARPDTSSWQINSILENNSQYWWIAQASDGFESGSASELSSFIVDTGNDSPSPFSLLNPIGMESVSVLNPTLTWSSSQDPDPMDEVTYTLILDTPAPGIETFDIGTDTTHQVITDLLDNTDYSWKVVASDLSGISIENTGGYQSFRVNTENDLPTPFQLLAPVSGAMVTNLNLQFLWEASSDTDDATIALREIGRGKFTEQTSSGNNSINVITGYEFYLGTDLELTDVVPVEVIGTSYIPTEELLENQVYYWTVSALDDSGGVTFSDTTSFWTNSVNSAPSDLSLLTPVLDAETGVNPTFSWTASEDEDLQDEISYTLKYGPDVFSLITVYTEMNTIFTPEELLSDNTEYIWQVVATDMSGATYETEFFALFVNSENDIPSDFNLVGPDSGSYLANANVMLVWNPTIDIEGDAIEYRVLFGETEESMTAIDTVDMNYYHLFALEDSYYVWQIEAMDGLGATVSSPVWGFLINANNNPPSNFDLLEPDLVHTTDSIPTFRWEASDPGDPGDEIVYRLYFVDDGDVAWVYAGVDTFWTPGPEHHLGDNSVWFWYVTAVDLADAVTICNGESRPLTINMFNDPPEPADLISPDSVVVLSDTPNFEWRESFDPDPWSIVSYEVHWWTETIEMDSILTDELSATPDPLVVDNLQYFWNVTSMDGIGGIAHSEEKTFWGDFMPEAPGAFALMGPDSASAGNGTRPELTWETSFDPDPFDRVYYHVVVATDSLLENVVYENISQVAALNLEVDLETDTRYFWQVTANDEDTLATLSETWTFDVGYLAMDPYDMLPEAFTLQQNFPNPFNPSTTIRYGLPEDAHVSLVIYDVLGNNVQTLESGAKSAGWYELVWNGQTNDGRTISTGLYFARIVAGEYSQMIKMLYLK